MKTKIKIKQAWNSFRFMFSFLLLFFYLTLAVLFLFTDMWLDFIPKGRGLIGLFFVLFAGLRFYISYYRFINKKEGIHSFVDQQIKRQDASNEQK